jgi:hypothetical protein
VTQTSASCTTLPKDCFDLGFGVPDLGWNPNSGKLFNLFSLSPLIYKMGLKIAPTEKYLHEDEIYEKCRGKVRTQSIMATSKYYYQAPTNKICCPVMAH